MLRPFTREWDGASGTAHAGAVEAGPAEQGSHTLMKHAMFSSLFGMALLGGAVLPVGVAQPVVTSTPKIVVSRDASGLEDFAAREVRRYLYLRAGCLSEVQTAGSAADLSGALIVVGRNDRALAKDLLADPAAKLSLATLGEQDYWLKSLEQGDRMITLVTGGSEVATLYAAYGFAEKLGVRFYLHGDVVPDERLPLPLPVMDERRMPLFALRGIQPFHDFPEGPDWWNREDYLAVMAQLPKLRMNFFGLHTYPEGAPNAEPTVWIGPGNEIGVRGEVTASYPASYQNTLRGNWGYEPRETGDFSFGARQLFEEDAFGNDVMYGHAPQPATAADENEVFNRAGEVLRDAFNYARALGVKTCVGTETPLTIPAGVQARLKAAGKDPASSEVVGELYEGMFRRIRAAYPVDYYWLWTPESWTWQGTSSAQVFDVLADIGLAVNALRRTEAPFQLATCGWVLGPPDDRSKFGRILPAGVAVSCINRQVGMEPVDPAFREVTGRSKWAIPWLEDDPALTSPQLWVGRMRRDAADARRYGCDGLLGIHWRTRAVAPNVAALAAGAWDQNGWNRQPLAPPEAPIQAGPVGGRYAAFPGAPIEGAAEPDVYRSVRYDVSAYHLPVRNGACRVTLKFCEPHYTEAGKRAFGVKLEGRTVIDRLDILEKVPRNRALDFTFEDVVVTDGWLTIEFLRIIEYPSIAGIVVESNGRPWRINCGGPAVGDYIADWPATPTQEENYIAAGDFYLDWAAHSFGPAVAGPVAAILAQVDCHLPRPSEWTNGPGGVSPDPRPWSTVSRDYDFVERLEMLAGDVSGAGNRARFGYWLNTFQYQRAVAELRCRWAEFNAALQSARSAADGARKETIARDQALPARIRLVAQLAEVYQHLLATVSTPGELGTVANWEQHIQPGLVERPGAELEALLGRPLPSEARVSLTYQGPTRVIVPTVRSSFRPAEPLAIKVLILAQQAPRSATVHWRKLGEGGFNEVPLVRFARGVYRANLPMPASAGRDLEYYVEVVDGAGRQVHFPSTAPALNQTLVRMPL